jgi:hypothetical protein
MQAEQRRKERAVQQHCDGRAVQRSAHNVLFPASRPARHVRLVEAARKAMTALYPDRDGL